MKPEDIYLKALNDIKAVTNPFQDNLENDKEYLGHYGAYSTASEAIKTGLILKKDREKNQPDSKFSILIITSVIIVITLFTLIWLLNRYWYGIPDNISDFGDSFNMGNTLFSALAFALLIVTAIMQRKELQLQRLELKETKKELSRTALAQEKSQEALDIQVTIMLRQSLIASYQSIYQTNFAVFKDKTTDSETKKQSALEMEKYLKLIKGIIRNIEFDSNFLNKTILDKRGAVAVQKQVRETLEKLQQKPK